MPPKELTKDSVQYKARAYVIFYMDYYERNPSWEEVVIGVNSYFNQHNLDTLRLWIKEMVTEGTLTYDEKLGKVTGYE